MYPACKGAPEVLTLLGRNAHALRISMDGTARIHFKGWHTLEPAAPSEAFRWPAAQAPSPGGRKTERFRSVR